MDLDLQLLRRGRFTAITWIFFLTTLLLLGFALAVPRGQDVLAVNGMHHPVLDFLFWILTNAGDGVLFVPLILILFFVRFHFAFVLLAVAAVHAILVSVFKRWLLAGATRPIMVLDHDLLHFVPGVDIHAHHSFPSGHTASIFAIAFFFSLAFNRKHMTALFLLLAVAVGISRIYLLQHFLTDVAAGAFIGIVSVLVAIIAFDRFKSRVFFRNRLVFERQQIAVRPSGDTMATD
jgi:membrane-associated phospholipid phosphatase